MIVVVGGTGHLGRVFVTALRAVGQPVRVVSRHAQPAPGVEAQVGDICDPAVTTAAAGGASVVVSMVHGLLSPSRSALADLDRDAQLRLAAAAQDNGASFIMMSVLDAQPDSDVELFAMKGQAEQSLRRDHPSATVVRASAFLETWVDVVRDTRGKGTRPLVLGRGHNPVNFVSVVDVAALLVALVQSEERTGMTYEVEGPDNITMTRFTELIQTADGLRASSRHLPRVALRLMSLQPFAPSRARLAELSLAMDRRPLARAVDATPEAHVRRGTVTLADVLSAERRDV